MVDDLDGEHAGLSCCVGKRIVPGKFWASHPRQTLSVGAQDDMRSYHSWTSAASLKDALEKTYYSTTPGPG